MEVTTKKEYEQYLNEVGKCLPEEDFIIGGKYRQMMYGTALRKYDPISFEVGYREWKSENQSKHYGH